MREAENDLLLHVIARFSSNRGIEGGDTIVVIKRTCASA